MASPTPLRVILSPGARVELMEIYAYNAEHRSIVEADRYEDFLLAGIGRLAHDHGDGKPVEGFPVLQAMTLRRRPRSYGHVVIYRVDQVSQTVRVLHIYHTAQDIAGRLSDD